MSTPAATTPDDNHALPHQALPAHQWPRDEHFGGASLLKIGMWVFLISDALSFSGLLISYGILRAGSEVWIHPGEPALGVNFTALLTFLLICSSVTMVLAVAAAKEGKRRALTINLALTILGGALFLLGQYHEYFGLVGHGLVDEGLHFGHSHYATTFYLITSFHGAHVLTGVIYNTVIFVRTLRGHYDNGRYDGVEAAGLFWHFVDLVWILVFTFVYLIP